MRKRGREVLNYIRGILFRFYAKKLLKYQGMVIITGPSVYFYCANLRPKKLAHCLKAKDWYAIPNYDAYIFFKSKGR